MLARNVCPDLKDPFRVAELIAAALTADPARLEDEAAQLCLTGGRRVVRVRGVSEALAKLFADFLKSSASCPLAGRSAGFSRMLHTPLQSGAIPIRRSTLRR